MLNDGLIILLVIAAVLVLAIIAWALLRKKRTDTLRSRYGDEYDRTVEAHGGRAGEANLVEREKRVAQFTIRPLDNSERERFGDEWREVKALFVDAPREAVLRGDRVVTEMLRTRGYPMADFDEQYENLTVDHAETASHYRSGHDIATSAEPTTEEMRRALNHYEALIDDMMRDAVPAAIEERVTGDASPPLENHPERPDDPNVIPVRRRAQEEPS